MNRRSETINPASTKRWSARAAEALEFVSTA
jgi:hypothetical protein